MSNDNPETISRDALVDRIEESWSALMSTMRAYPEVSYTAETDAAGWTALDHMAHVTAWERTWTFLLNGRTRHEGLGVTEQQFEMDFDPLNEILRARTANDSYEQVLTDAREGHEKFVDAVRSAKVDELDIEQRNEESLVSLLMENVVTHYNDHRGYIEDMIAT